MADDGNRYPLTRTVHLFLISLRSELRNFVNFMNIFTLNVQSLVPKFVELRSFLLSSIFHVLVFSETWLKSSHSNQLVSFEGFSVFRCYRFRAAHGGVALYINKCY
jgi:hypothetical protein